MKLISLEERVDQLESELSKGSVKLGDFANKVIAHKNLLKLPPHPSQFVVMDDDGNILEEPKDDSYLGGRGGVDAIKLLQYEKLKDQWKQSKSKVLFEGFYQICNNSFSNGKISVTFTKSGGILLDRNKIDYVENIGTITTISDLIPYNLTLNNNAKQIIGV